MRCFKLLGEQVMARDFERQVAERQVRAAMLNRLTRLGRFGQKRKFVGLPIWLYKC